MYKVYEVDPDADTLLIVPASTKDLARAEGKDAQAATATPLELRIKVSSKHLSLASKDFKNQLKWKWEASDAPQPDGRIHVVLEGFDPAAVTIVMNIIHGRGSKVPKSVDAETLANIAVFVDEYKLFDPVEIYADRWARQLPDSVFAEDEINVARWIYISYVFRRPATFKLVTRTAILKSTGPITSVGLPIREKIIKSIDEMRQKLVTEGLSVIDGVLEDLVDGKAPCASGCDALLLGTLLKTLRRDKLAWPSPTKPFSGISFGTVQTAVSDFQTQVSKLESAPWQTQSTVREQTRKRKTPNTHPAQGPTPDSSPELATLSLSFSADVHNCKEKIAMQSKLETIGSRVQGLELESSRGHYLY
ncbi:hypothetical protein NKR23_g4332 [Pleurostoma richardsiae]|uniref:BTB domain-containing protein n=1 Tax=Pleurostoma richardsiae TaxID=41990 RepID=A0AA38VS98_9PEZI|nr:hypothetical protein NKR23_g4332 [Pleurostoma richardsiae]